MKITPLEIRQKTFEKVFRGLDKDEVNAFLITMSQEWEKLLDENKELKIKLQASEREVGKLREVENSLFKTLKTAEDTGANMIDQATKTADLHMRETQMKAAAIMSDAKGKAKDLIEEAEIKSKHTIDDMEDQIRTMAQVYRSLENVKEDLMSDIRSFANDALEKVERVNAHTRKFDVEKELLRVKRESVENAAKASVKFKNDHALNEVEQEPQDKVPAAERKNGNKSTSFFDDIE